MAGNKTKLSGFTSYIHSIYSCVYNIIAALYSSCIWFFQCVDTVNVCVYTVQRALGMCCVLAKLCVCA